MSQELGKRFYVSPCRKRDLWLTIYEKEQCYPDWVDCTDMPDDEFEAFLLNPPTEEKNERRI